MISHVPLLDSTTPPPPSRLRAITDRGGYDYLLSLPEDYAAESPRSWPLLLFLHGTAPRGTNVWDVTQHGPTRLLAGIGRSLLPADGPQESPASSPLLADELTATETAAAAELSRTFVVVAPQCPPYEVWDDAAVLALLDDIGRELNIDVARVYLTGLSMGGFGAWSVAMRFPQRFAAIMPVCGGGRVADVAAAARNHRAALEQLGVWAFHGARDLVVPLEESERMIAALKRAGVRDARLTVYPEAGHDAWTEAYANREVYAWLLRHAR